MLLRNPLWEMQVRRLQCKGSVSIQCGTFVFAGYSYTHLHSTEKYAHTNCSVTLPVLCETYNKVRTHLASV